MENPILENIRTRRSIRQYRTEQVTDEELKAVLEAGTYAPTSRGMQAPFIVAVQNEQIKAKLVKLNARIMGTDGNPYYGAPTIVLVLAPADARYPIHDGSCILENMMLAAHAVGLASCWIHREKEMFELPEGKALLREMNLPDTLIGIGALALGYADAQPSPEKPRKPDYITIIK